jgi:Fe-Mn family superoxide dismutase
LFPNNRSSLALEDSSMSRTHSRSSSLNRRGFLQRAGATALAVGTVGFVGQRQARAQAPVATYPFTLPPLPYAYDALEPTIDTLTMQIHHDKHHQAYITNLNKALEPHPELHSKSLKELLQGLDDLPEMLRIAVRNQGGGHYNHSMFWQIMGPGKGGEPSGALAEAISSKFGNFANFKEAFNKAAIGRFGSGWAWLSLDPSSGLVLDSLANQDCPVSSKRQPILGLDVWEHAYYLKYQNLRPAYVAAWWNVVNWDAVSARYQAAKG